MQIIESNLHIITVSFKLDIVLFGFKLQNETEAKEAKELEKQRAKEAKAQAKTKKNVKGGKSYNYNSKTRRRI